MIKDTHLFMQSPFFHAELELTTYNRAYLINFSKSPLIYLLILIFINIFDLYRNIYRSILRIYVIIMRLN